ncbi:MAG TPA: Ldh family oxidoreductase [Ramlibacter sp.]|nr:Ldh family oxidoreductase [Ramlibacter sp.]
MSSLLLDHRTARATAIAALERAGAPADHAATQAELLVEADLWDRPSHGLMRLPRVIARIRNGVCDPATRGVAHWRAPAFLEVDGGNGLGPVVANAALDAISERARDSGVALAAVRHNNHLGMLGWYAERVAARGQVLLALSTSEALVHPWGGRRALVGTNPIAIGVPAEPHPFVLDMATSRVSMGEIHDRANRGLAIPADWALDAAGEPTTDPNAARAGAIAPFGGAKGYALGLAFEVLVTALTGAAIGRAVKGTLDATEPCNKGDLFLVAQADSAAAASLSAYLAEIRHCPPARADAPVLVPGDRARERRARRLETGISLPSAVWQEIACAAAG